MLRRVPPYDEVVAIFQNGEHAISSTQFQTALTQTLRQYVNVLSSWVPKTEPINYSSLR